MKRIALGLAALVAVVSIAFAAGQFAGLPIVGGASYCQGQSTGTTGQVCTVTVPAGPTIVTGNELIPADTQLANGAMPQTVYLSLASINALPYVYNVPANATTVTVAATTGKLILNPAGTLTTLGVSLPAAVALVDGQTFELSSSQTLTALTIGLGTGTTMSNTPTALTISTTAAYGYRWLFHVTASTAATGLPSTGVWYRLQ